jgi:DNA-binding transcriptional regulator GbsR (MarR family)
VTAGDWQLEFLARAAGMADLTGLPPSFMKVFAWLVVCEPPDQSLDDMRAALKLSAGSISTATTTLVRMGVVERVTRHGERRVYYCIRSGGWERLMRIRLDATTQMRVIAEKALSRAPGPQQRLTEMRDLYAFFEQALAGMLDEAAP